MLNLLLIDDSPEDLELFTTMIQRSFKDQCHIEKALTWHEGLTKILSQPFDIIILDIYLPDTNELEALEELKKRSIDIPCIILTGFDLPKQDIEALKLGAIDFLKKGDVNQVSLERSILYAIEKGRLIKELVEANQIKERFISILSHDLKTPLAVIINSIQLLLEEQGDSPLTPFQKDRLEKVRRLSQFLNRLIETILQACLLYKGKITPRKQNFNFIDILDNSLAIYQDMASEKNIAFIKECPKEIMVCADPDMLMQILNNLIWNAIKFTEEGSIKILAEKEDHSLIIKVKDTGIGIDKVDFNKLFLPFSQIHTDHHLHEGTGLGLSIIKFIVDLYEGHIHIKSEVDKGTEFTISLPIIKDQSSSAPHQQEL